MKRLFIIFILFFVFILDLFSEKLEFHDSIHGSTFIHTNNEGKKTENYLFDPIWGKTNKNLYKLLSKYPKSLSTFKLGKSIKFGGYLSLFSGPVFGIYSISYPIGYVVNSYLNGSNIDFSNVLQMLEIFLPSSLLLLFGVPLIVLGLLLLKYFNKWFEKAFKIFNDKKEKIRSLIRTSS